MVKQFSIISLYHVVDNDTNIFTRVLRHVSIEVKLQSNLSLADMRYSGNLYSGQIFSERVESRSNFHRKTS